MNELTKFLVDAILAEEGSQIERVIAVFSGRFQPFHKGHYDNYQRLVKKFGKDSVYIGTSNKVEKPTSPFSFKEKEQIMTRMFGIPKDKIVQVKNPYRPTEILKKYDEETTAVVFFVSEKDATRLGGKYFQPWNENPTVGYKEGGYVYTMPPGGGGVSGTEVRRALSSDDESERVDMFKKLYPKFDKKIYNLITSKLVNEAYEPLYVPANLLKEWKRDRFPNILNEITINSGFPTSGDLKKKRMTSFIGNDDIYHTVHKDRAEKIGYQLMKHILDKDMGDFVEYDVDFKTIDPSEAFIEDVIGRLTGTSADDFDTRKQYHDWFQNVTNQMALTGYDIYSYTKDGQRTIDGDMTYSTDGFDTTPQPRSNTPKHSKDEIDAELEDHLKEEVDPIYISKEIIEDWVIKKSQNVIQEVSAIGGGGEVDDGPNFMYPNYDVYSKISADRAAHLGFTVVDQIMKKELEDYYEHPKYPKGPIQAVSSYPAGVIGKLTATNQLDFVSMEAYDSWFKHVTRKMALVGYSLVHHRDDVERELSTKYLKDLDDIIQQHTGKPVTLDDVDGKFLDMMDESLMIGYEGSDDYKKRKKRLKKLRKQLDDTTPNSNEYSKVKEDFDKIQYYTNYYRNLSPDSMVVESKGSTIQIKPKAGTLREAIDETDEGNDPFVVDIEQITVDNTNYRTTKWTGEHLQMTLMSIDDEIGLEVHEDDDQFIRIERGSGIVKMGKEKDNLTFEREVKDDFAIFIPAGWWHNIINTSDTAMKLYSIYAPPHHEVGSVTKQKTNEIITLTEAQNKLKLNIPKDIKDIHSAFKREGKKLYVVGGAVRDAILGKKPKDFDLATDAKPDEVLDIAKKYGMKSTAVGKAFGVVMVNDNEIATFRKDIGKGRRPDSVDYTDIEGDVKRRDLTINALFYDIDRGEIVDLVGGIADLQQNRIRTVGKAAERFDEDPLRKLRVLRFASRMGSKIEDATLEALKADPSLAGVSPERIRDEFIKSIQSAKSTKQYLTLADDVKILQQIFPRQSYRKGNFIDHNDHRFVVAYLLKHNTPKSLYQYLMKLKYPHAEANDIKFLTNLLDFDADDILVLKKLQENVTLTDKEILEWGKIAGINLSKFVKFNLSVKGDEVMKMGYKGADIGKQIAKMETDRFLNESVTTAKGKQISTFKELFKEMPSELQKRVYNLKNIPQRPDAHPEGNTLKHTIVVVNRALKEEDIDLAIAAIMHDIGKDETAEYNPTKGFWTAHGHEKVSAKLVKDYTQWIKEMGASVANVYYIVKNHMRYKKLQQMRPGKQKKLKSFRAFDKLQRFSKHDRGGLDEARFMLPPGLKFIPKKSFEGIKRGLKYTVNAVKGTIGDLTVVVSPSGSSKKIPVKVRSLEEFYRYVMMESVDKEALDEYVTNLMGSDELMMEGGAYGHLSHPFETDLNLTFGQLKDIINKALDGELELAKEKTDGQNLAVSWIDGELKAARNKSHLKNRGENAMTIAQLASKFAGRGGLTKAYNAAMEDLSNAIGSLTDKQREKIFDNGAKFMSLEVMYPESVNIIPYGQPLLVFHGTLEFDLAGNPIGEDPQAGRILAGMIKQINKDVQKTYSIRQQPVVKLPKSQDLSKQKSKYISQLRKLQSEFKLSDRDTVQDYHKEWWTDYIEKNAPVKLNVDVRDGLISRWALDDKSFRLNAKNLEDKDLLKWAQKVDKTNLNDIRKQNFTKFEHIFLGVGAELLSFISSVLVVNPDSAVQKMKNQLDSVVKDIQKTGDPNKIDKLKKELERLEAIGGMDKIVPIEGLVFTGPDGRLLKLTGTFAPLNQIINLAWH